jgi:hypothetical protein
LLCKHLFLQAKVKQAEFYNKVELAVALLLSVIVNVLVTGVFASANGQQNLDLQGA